MLSACSGSFSKRYRSAFANAAGSAACEMRLSSTPMAPPPRSCLLPSEHPEQPLHRIIEPVDHALLHRNDRVVGDVNVLGAHVRAALRDVAQPDAAFFPQMLQPIIRVERLHLERRAVHEKARPHELGMHVVVPEDVANVLAQKALDALSELLHALDV